MVLNCSHCSANCSERTILSVAILLPLARQARIRTNHSFSSVLPGSCSYRSISADSNPDKSRLSSIVGISSATASRGYLSGTGNNSSQGAISARSSRKTSICCDSLLVQSFMPAPSSLSFPVSPAASAASFSRRFFTLSIDRSSSIAIVNSSSIMTVDPYTCFSGRSRMILTVVRSPS